MAWRLMAKNGNFKAFYWFLRITTVTLIVIPQEESRLLDLYNKQPACIANLQMHWAEMQSCVVIERRDKILYCVWT
jgi:hypothetical protein